MLKLDNEYMGVHYVLYSILWGIFNEIQNTSYICYLKLEHHKAIHSEFSVKITFKLQFCFQSTVLIMRKRKLKIFSNNVSKIKQSLALAGKAQLVGALSIHQKVEGLILGQ